MTREKSTSTPLSLYPIQRAIVEAFAAQTNRTFSNAVQFIIEDWARLVSPETQLAIQSTSKQSAHRKRAKLAPSQIEGFKSDIAAQEIA